MDRGAWRGIVHRIAKNWTRLKRQHQNETGNFEKAERNGINKMLFIAKISNSGNKFKQWQCTIVLGLGMGICASRVFHFYIYISWSTWYCGGHKAPQI